MGYILLEVDIVFGFGLDQAKQYHISCKCTAKGNQDLKTIYQVVLLQTAAIFGLFIVVEAH